MSLTEETKKLAGGIVAVAAVIGLCFGVYFHFQSQFAPKALAEEVKQFRQEYQYDKTLNFKNKAMERIWTIKERHGESPKEQTVKEELRGLEQKVQDLNEQIRAMEKK